MVNDRIDQRRWNLIRGGRYANPDSDMTVTDLEREIERAFKLKYDYDELPRAIGASPVQSKSLNASKEQRDMRLFGMHIEPGQEVQLDKVMEPPGPFEITIDPWPDEEPEIGWAARFKDWFYRDRNF